MDQRRPQGQDVQIGSSQRAPLGVLVDVFFLGVMNTHKRLDRFDDTLRVANEIAVRIVGRQPVGNVAQKAAEMHDFAMGSPHRAEAMTVREVSGKSWVDFGFVVFLVPHDLPLDYAICF